MKKYFDVYMDIFQFLDRNILEKCQLVSYSWNTSIRNKSSVLPLRFLSNMYLYPDCVGSVDSVIPMPKNYDIASDLTKQYLKYCYINQLHVPCLPDQDANIIINYVNSIFSIVKQQINTNFCVIRLEINDIRKFNDVTQCVAKCFLIHTLKFVIPFFNIFESISNIPDSIHLPMIKNIDLGIQLRDFKPGYDVRTSYTTLNCLYRLIATHNGANLSHIEYYFANSFVNKFDGDVDVLKQLIRIYQESDNPLLMFRQITILSTILYYRIDELDERMKNYGVMRTEVEAFAWLFDEPIRQYEIVHKNGKGLLKIHIFDDGNIKCYILGNGEICLFEYGSGETWTPLQFYR